MDILFIVPIITLNNRALSDEFYEGLNCRQLQVHGGFISSFFFEKKKLCNQERAILTSCCLRWHILKQIPRKVVQYFTSSISLTHFRTLNQQLI